MGREFSDQDIRRIAREVIRGEKSIRNRRPRGQRRGSMEDGGASRVKGKLVTAMSGVGTHTMDNVVAISGVSPLSDPTSTTETLEIDNSHFAWDGDNDAIAYAEYHPSDATWHLYQVRCPT